jgi:antitoxin PrlF
VEISKVTSKFQATVPADVRAALGIKAGDRILWSVKDGTAIMRKMPEDLKGWEPLAWLSFADEWLSPEDEEAFRDLQSL